MDRTQLLKIFLRDTDMMRKSLYMALAVTVSDNKNIDLVNKT